MLNLEQILENMWVDYLKLNPKAYDVFTLLTQSGNKIENDHIALRTFDMAPLGIDQMAAPFIALGYQEKGVYEFVQKKLYAKHFEHQDPTQPKVFISELQVNKLSVSAQSLIKKLTSQLKPEFLARQDMSLAGRPWEVSFADYQILAAESEYAGWVAAHGFRPNHFTVNVNALAQFTELHDLNLFLQKNGHNLNASGGLIKGSAAEMLEQSSTIAEQVLVSFVEGDFEVPGCYYEFAKRYQLKDGQIYQGFIAKSADKIFESTNRSH